MLELDLNRLRGGRTVELEEDVPVGAALLQAGELRLLEPMHVSVSAREAGSDVVVRGRLSGRIAAECRRCLKELELDVGEPIAALFTTSFGPEDAGAEEVYPLAADARVLDLADWVRESVLLAVPRFAVCSETCRGLCQHCGRDLNEGDCDCDVEVTDARWGPLRDLADPE